MKVYRRGCLKGPIFVQRGIACCNCEMIGYDCK